MVMIASVKNNLLNTLSNKEIEELGADLQLITFTLRQTMHEAGQLIQHVYFPEDMLASVIAVMTDGAMVEVGMISSEGLVGVSASLGKKHAAHQVIVQVQGSAYRMDVARYRALFEKNTAFRNAVMLFLDNFLSLTSQTSACNRLHSIEQRFARWLLMSTDRVQSDTIPMTHEFLSAMLGSRRAGVTETAGEIQRMGLIRYHHGQLTILDRNGLEKVACECYNTDHMKIKNLRKKEALNT